MTILWYGVLGALLALHGALGGIDYGVGMRLPFLPAPARRPALNAIGAMFLGNEVWIVAGAGVLLAAFPRAEAALPYPTLVVFVIGLVVVSAGVQLRGRVGRGERAFDPVIAVGGVLVAGGFGALFGSLVAGGGWPLLFAVAQVLLVAAHGRAFLAWRSGASPSRWPGLTAALAVVAVLACGGAYHLRHPLTGLVLGLVVVLAAVGVGLFRRPGLAFLAGLVATGLPVVAVGAATYPDLAPAGASTLHLLTVAVAPVLPVLVVVQGLCWWLFRRGSRVVYW